MRVIINRCNYIYIYIIKTSTFFFLFIYFCLHLKREMCEQISCTHFLICLHPSKEKLLSPSGGLLMLSSLTSQPIKCCYLCKCDIIQSFLFFIHCTDQEAHTYICIDSIISLFREDHIISPFSINNNFSPKRKPFRLLIYKNNSL